MLTFARSWLLAGALAASGLAVPPRFEFQPGLVLVYRVRLRAASAGAPAELLHEQILRVTCLRQDADRWLLLVDIGPIGSDAPGLARGVLMWIDRRGRRTVQPETLPALWDQRELPELWPLLPEAIDPDRRWSSPPDELGRVWTFRREGDDHIAFEVRDPAPLGSLIGRRHAGTLRFDLKRGVVRRVESRICPRAGLSERIRTTRLEWSERHDAAWLRARSAELEGWLRALRVEQRLVRDWATQPARIRSDLERIGRLWRDLLASMPDRDSPLRDLVRSRLERLERDARRWRRWAAFDRTIFGRVAAPWSLTGARGQTVRSDTDPPQVAVECFWTLRSEPSLRVLEALSRLSRGRPSVRFVAISVDREPDALTAAGPLLAGLTAVTGGVAMGPQAGPELPMIRVLDRLRRVRAILHGWRPDSAALLAELVERVQREGD